MFILFAERKVGEQHGPAAQGVLAAVQTLREMNADNLRKVPADAPTAFIKPRWKPLVITPEGLDRKFYEICALSELKNALRSGDIWVKGSRQFRDFDDYLLPAEKFAALKREQALPLAINPNSDQYLEERLQLLDEQLATVTRLAKDNELPDAILTESGLKITPLDAAVPDRAQALIDQTSQLLPRIKITELLMDVDDWTGLRGDVHAFSDPDSNSGYLVTTALLAENRTTPDRFFSHHFFTYGHRNVVRAVASRLAQSGSVDGYVWEVMRETEPDLVAQTKVLRRSEWLGFPPVAAPRLLAGDPRLAAIRDALTGMKDDPEGQAVLKLLRLDGFVVTEPSLFDTIAAKMDVVRRLG